MNRVLSIPRKRGSKVRVSLWTPAFAGVTIAERRSLLSHTLASGESSADSERPLERGRRGPTGVPKDARLPTGYGPRLVLSFSRLIRQDRAPPIGQRHRPAVGGDGS